MLYFKVFKVVSVLLDSFSLHLTHFGPKNKKNKWFNMIWTLKFDVLRFQLCLIWWHLWSLVVTAGTPWRLIKRFRSKFRDESNCFYEKLWAEFYSSAILMAQNLNLSVNAVNCKCSAVQVQRAIKCKHLREIQVCVVKYSTWVKVPLNKLLKLLFSDGKSPFIFKHTHTHCLLCILTLSKHGEEQSDWSTSAAVHTHTHTFVFWFQWCFLETLLLNSFNRQ